MVFLNGILFVFRLIGYRKPQNTRQLALLSGVSPGRWLRYPRVSQSVDWSDTGNRETPDSSLFCRASAQAGDSDSRESVSLSTDRIPETTKHQTDRLSVGRKPRPVTQIAESQSVCRLIGYRKPQNTRQLNLLSGVSPGWWLRCPRAGQSVN